MIDGRPAAWIREGTLSGRPLVILAHGSGAVVISPARSVRHVAIFGRKVKIRPNFSGEVGPVSLRVRDDATEIRHKHRITRKPAVVPTVELANIISLLDSMGVSINDIIGFLAMMDRQKALTVGVHWME